MYTCPNCNFSTESAMNFCTHCGTAMTKSDPAPYVAEPTYQPYTPPYNPVYTVSTPPAQKPNMAKKIVGMSLSIFGFVFAIISAMVSLATIEAMGAGFAVTLYFSFFSLPTCIIGFIFSKAAREQGDTSAFSGVGKALGLAGIIVMGVALAISFLALVAYF